MTDVRRESAVEREGNYYAKKRGWKVMKFVSPSLRAVPDRLYLRMKKGVSRTVFIEWKRPGEKPTEQQLKRGREIQESGAEWYWADCLEDIKDVLY